MTGEKGRSVAKVYEVWTDKLGPPPPETIPVIMHTLITDCVLSIVAGMYEMRLEGQALNAYLLEGAPDSVAVNTVYNETCSFLRYCIVNSQLNVLRSRMKMLRVPGYEDMHPCTILALEMSKDPNHFMGLAEVYETTIPQLLDDLQDFVNTPKDGWRRFSKE